MEEAGIDESSATLARNYASPTTRGGIVAISHRRFAISLRKWEKTARELELVDRSLR
jgi:hypothetical protein